jgi:transposase InsO family protein
MAFEYQLGEAPETIRLQFEQNPLQLASETNQQMLAQFDKAYETNRLLSDFKSALKKQFTPEYQTKISDWFARDYVQEISQARRDYHTLQGKRKRIITRYELDQSPAAELRKKMISTLTETTSAGESSIESSVIVFRSVLKALSQLSTQRRLNEVQIEGITNNFREQQQNQAGNSFNREQLIMYNQVSDDMLERYISFWNTETGRWLDKAISESLQTAYQQSAERFLESVNSN